MAIRASTRTGRAIASVLIDRGFGVLATLGYAALGFVLLPHPFEILDGPNVRWHTPEPAVISLAIAAAAAAILLLSRSRRVRSLWRDGRITLRNLAHSPRLLARTLALSVVSQGLIVLLWYTLARGMSFMLPVSFFLWAVPIVSLSALLPVTFAGLGVREGAWLVLLASSGIPPADIVAYSLLYFGCNLLVGVIGGILFVSRGLSLDRPQE
jgi:uncharacterized membrane protein YbhN (UPF0104 family)